MVFISANMMSWDDQGLWSQKGLGLNQGFSTWGKAPFLSPENTGQYF